MRYANASYILGESCISSRPLPMIIWICRAAMANVRKAKQLSARSVYLRCTTQKAKCDVDSLSEIAHDARSFEVSIWRLADSGFVTTTGTGASLTLSVVIWIFHCYCFYLLDGCVCLLLSCGQYCEAATPRSANTRSIDFVRRINKQRHKPLCASSLDSLVTRSQDVGSCILVRPVRCGMCMAWYASTVDDSRL